MSTNSGGLPARRLLWWTLEKGSRVGEVQDGGRPLYTSGLGTVRACKLILPAVAACRFSGRSEFLVK